MDTIHLADPSRQGKVFVDIGANKGYTLARWQARWAPEVSTQIEPNLLRQQAIYWTSIFDALNGSKLPPGDACGGCSDCEDVPAHNFSAEYAAGGLGDVSGVQFVAVEAAPSTFRALTDSPVAKTMAQAGGLILVEAAAGASPGSMPFLDCDVGIEFCNGLNEAKSKTYSAVLVRAVTVDSLLEELHLTNVFWLQIDAEGMDPLILFGAHRALTEGRVGVLGFEVSAICCVYAATIAYPIYFIAVSFHGIVG